ncbi:MAG: fibronectin type III domain-containing protein, partial [Lachnospiraceae bacterium]|nr:fibronectin type III domain-containing protein [Lachnospiraceae bacterium]
ADAKAADEQAAKDAAAAAKVTNLKIKSKARKFTVTWKAAEGVTGYEVQYKLKSAKKWSNLKKATTKTKVVSKKLKKGKKYQVRVRPYTEIGGEKIFGKYVTKAKKCS